MINGLIRFAVSQRLLVLLMVAIMIGAGLYSLLNLPIDAVPDVTNVQVQVLTAAPSLAPLEIERQITFSGGSRHEWTARSRRNSFLIQVWSLRRYRGVRRFGGYLFRPSTCARTTFAGP